MSNGTPKSLWSAIVNGLVQAKTVGMTTEEAEELAWEIHPHVIDFLAQRLGPAILEANENESDQLLKLFRSIKGDDDGK